MEQSPVEIGPYRIVGTLGRGSAGIVYRGEHRGTGERVAVKTVVLPRERRLATLRREIHALARLGHPGVVRILAHGVVQGMPWYAMELIEGPTLREHCQEIWRPVGQNAAHTSIGAGVDCGSGLSASPNGDDSGQVAAQRSDPRALAAFLSVFRRLCAPLAFLHGEGLIHRDLKPGNVLVREGGTPVIVDFGLTARWPLAGLGESHHHDHRPTRPRGGSVERVQPDARLPGSGEGSVLSREALELGGAMLGTVAYMAPEQIGGEFVDARSDLYALGCILYELLTGRPPFLGANPAAVLRQHLRAEPVPPSQLVQGLPAELDALLLRLLAKQPRERLGHAGDVAAALARLGADDGLAAAGPRPRTYLYRPGFVGREEAFDQLLGHFDRLEDGAGGVLLLSGESGVGKTRLLMELAREAADRELIIFAAECQPLPVGDGASDAGSVEALSAFKRPLQALADRCREKSREETEGLLGRHAGLLALYEPSLASLPGVESAPEPAELPPEAARHRLFRTLAGILEALAKDRPVLVLLDDLQWADGLSVGFLEFLLRLEDLERMGVLVVGTYRSDEVTEVLRSLIASPRVRGFEVDRLTEAAVGALVRDMLAMVSPPAVFARFLARHSEGNPFFVAEYLRAAVSEGLLYRDESGGWQVVRHGEDGGEPSVYETLPLPRSLRDLVGRRIDGLSDGARHLLEAAAVLGRESDGALLQDVGQLEGAEGLEALSELLARQVLEETHVECLRFSHDKIRELAYETLAGDRKQKLHGVAAQAIEERCGQEREEYLAVLGHHYEKAGLVDEACECHLGGARRAVRRYAHGEAERLYRAYLALVEQGSAESVKIRRELAGKVLFVQGRNEEAIAEHREALEQARLLGLRALEAGCLSDLATVAMATGRLDEAMEMCKEGHAIIRDSGEPRLEAKLLDTLAVIHGYQGRLDRSQELHRQALELFRRIGARHRESMTLNNLAFAAWQQGRLERARPLLEEALSIVRELGNRRQEGKQLGNLAVIYREQGRLEEARTMREEALEIQREVGDRQAEGIDLANLAVIYRDQGSFDEARGLCEQALAIHREVGDRIWEGGTLSDLARGYRQQGRYEEAANLYPQALAILRQVGDRRKEAITLLGMGMLERCRAEDFDRAEGLAREAGDIATSLGSDVLVAKCLCEHGFIALARGRSGHPFLEKARGHATRAASSDWELTAALEQLERAVQESNENRPLFGGGPPCAPAGDTSESSPRS